MPTVSELEQQFYAAAMGLDTDGYLPGISDLRYLFYLGVYTGQITLGGASPAEIQQSVDNYLTTHPVAGTTDASELTAGTLAVERLPAGVAMESEVVSMISGKANSAHQHTSSDITNFAAAVASLITNKADVNHAHATSSITDFVTAVDARIQNIVGAAPEALNTLQEIAARIESESTEGDALVAALTAKADKSYVDALPRTSWIGTLTAGPVVKDAIVVANGGRIYRSRKAHTSGGNVATAGDGEFWEWIGYHASSAEVLTTLNGILVVDAGSDPNFPRPVGPRVVYWICTAQPLGMTEDDFWNGPVS